MATTGKVPMLGFKATAIKFAALFGFSPSTAAAATSRIVDLDGSYVPIQSLTGSVLAVVIAGSYVPTQTLSGSVS